MSSIINGYYPRTARRYATYPISVLITFLRYVITKMTGNVSFPNPMPTLAVLAAATDELEIKTQAALNGGRIEMAARRAAEATALSLARQLGNYVESQANGDLEVLLSSGFEAVRAPSPSVIPATPDNQNLSYTGISGQLLFRFTGDYNVRNFSVQHAENADGPWTDHGLSTSTRVLLEDLTPGKTYWARASANGAAGTSDWCAPTSLMAV
ncbi:MAG: fibronectin type III domain-containing protein [Verrucomicrobiota bacterium]|nr:fibronectin type III domain-containing protein [Verrucomicrobiota bacterium]